ncbi:hypothetical protein Tco_0693999 [Tanacetum coccineum]
MGTDPTVRLQRESKKTCCQSGQSGTLVRQGFVVIVTADADYLSRMSTNLAGGLRKRHATDMRPSCCIRAVASVTLSLVPACYVYYLFGWAKALM